MRGSPRAFQLYNHATQSSGHLYFHPVDGRLVFVACFLIAAMVVIGWRLIAEKCRCSHAK